MKLEDLLKGTELRRLKLLSGQDGLKREIATVESTETPDVALYLPKNTLLLTTAMAYKEHPDDLCRLIRQLNELPTAGLAIKLGRFLNALPQKAQELADELHFPLLQIPIDMTLGEVYHQALAAIWNDKNAELTQALNTQKKFSNLILQGAGMKAMLNNLGYTLECPVAILSPFGVVHDYNHTCTEKNLSAARTAFEEMHLYSRWNWDTLHFFDAKDSNRKISIFPIKVVGRYTHSLFVFDAECIARAASVLVVEQVLLILGLTLYKNLYLSYSVIKHKSDFLKVLMQREKEGHWSSLQMLRMGEEFGVRSSPCYRVVAAPLDPKHSKQFNPNEFAYQEERYIQIFEWLEQVLDQIHHGSVLVFPEPEHFRYIFLVQGTKHDLEESLLEIHATLLKIYQVEIVFAFGNNRYELDAVEQSYREALESCENGEMRDDVTCMRYYRPRNVVELLKTVLNDQSKGYCLHLLKGLAYPKDEMTLELQKTLRTYLECKCSVTETANRMFLHRNTIKYRVKRCEEILESDFTDAQYCFELQLSLMLTESP